MSAPKNSIPIEVLDAAIRGWFGTVPETKDQQQHFRHRMRTALIAAQWTGPAAGDARDAEQLDFLANYGAWIDRAKDREYCRVHRRNCLTGFRASEMRLFLKTGLSAQGVKVLGAKRKKREKHRFGSCINGPRG